MACQGAQGGKGGLRILLSHCLILPLGYRLMLKGNPRGPADMAILVPQIFPGLHDSAGLGLMQYLELLTQLAGEHSVIVVEHDMEFVRSIARKVTVLHEGSVLAEGTMDAVQNDQRVIEVYLGA